MTRLILGLNILTATSFPSWRVAKCTWATDALAMGVESNVLKILSSDIPYEAVIIFSAFL